MTKTTTTKTTEETDKIKEATITISPCHDDHMAQFYDEDLDNGQGTYLSDGVYVLPDGSLYDSKG